MLGAARNPGALAMSYVRSLSIKKNRPIGTDSIDRSVQEGYKFFAPGWLGWE
ncbi:hypothetical protein D3C72_1223180 [compost metagenome]